MLFFDPIVENVIQKKPELCSAYNSLVKKLKRTDQFRKIRNIGLGAVAAGGCTAAAIFSWGLLGAGCFAATFAELGSTGSAAIYTRKESQILFSAVLQGGDLDPYLQKRAEASRYLVSTGLSAFGASAIPRAIPVASKLAQFELPTMARARRVPEVAERLPSRKARAAIFRRIKDATGAPLQAYSARNTDAFQIVGTAEGRHGGKQLLVERLGSWGDGRKDFSKGGGDIAWDLRTWPTVMGDDSARYFSYELVDSRHVLIPDENEIIGAVAKFNDGLPVGSIERIGMAYYPTPHSFITSSKYIEKFVEDGAIPISTNGRQYYHDVSAHSMEGFYIHNEIFDVLRARSKSWLDFVKAQHGLSPDDAASLKEVNKEVVSSLTGQVDQTGNLLTAYMGKVDKKYLEAVGQQVIIQEIRNPRSTARHMDTYPVAPPGRTYVSDLLPTLISDRPEAFFNLYLSKATPEVQRRYRDFMAAYEGRDTLKPMSFDWQKDLDWISKNADRIAKKDPTAINEFAKLEITRPFFLRLNRLRSLTGQQ